MTTYVALLRGINVGGHGIVSMVELRAAMERAGCANVRTILQSGDVVFDTGHRSPAALETKLERDAAKRFTVQPDFMVRTASEWQTLIAANPFAAEAKRLPQLTVLMLLKAAPSAERVTALRSAIRGRETMHVDGRALYAVYPDGQGRSKFTNALIETRLGTRATARNWNTVLKLAAAIG